MQIWCTGQKPNSDVVRSLSPLSIDHEGYVKVKPTLQIDDEAFPNIYVCGDVAATGERNPNARSAMRAAMVVADNILRATEGKKPKHKYRPHWADAVIKLTLGLVSSLLLWCQGGG
jgi:apoptosis-inducing factor 2